MPAKATSENVPPVLGAEQSRLLRAHLLRNSCVEFEQLEREHRLRLINGGHIFDVDTPGPTHEGSGNDDQLALPVAESAHAWLTSFADHAVGSNSARTQPERDVVSPGIELVAGALAAQLHTARADLEATRRILTTDPAELASLSPGDDQPRATEAATRVQSAVADRARETVRVLIADAVRWSRRSGSDDRQLATLLREAADHLDEVADDESNAPRRLNLVEDSQRQGWKR